jgi:hypothetical protein
VDELVFLFYVTLRWFLRSKYKIKRCAAFIFEVRFSRSTLFWEIVAGCRPVSQQECIQEDIDLSLRSQFQEFALGCVEKTFGPSICFGDFLW